MIVKANMKKMFKKANIGSGNTVNIGGASPMAFKLNGPDRKISTAIKNAEERKRKKKKFSEDSQMPPATPRVMGDQVLQKGGFNIAAIEAKEAGKDSFTYAGKEFPVTKRMKEDGDGMYRMETMRPMNPMGAVPLQKNEMPMAYKHKVYKSTGSAKAVPFTAK